MELQEYIDSVGAKPLAELMKVTDSTISYWRTYKHAVPALDAFKLIKISHGALSWESIYEPFIDSYLKANNFKKNKIGVQLEFPF